MTRLAVLLVPVFVLIAAHAVAADPPRPVAIGSLQATTPTEWIVVKPANRLRSHQFRLPSGEDGVADGEINVRPQSSIRSEKEFPRWKAEVVPPDGMTIDDVSKESTFEVAGTRVHVLDVVGTWKYKEFPQAKKEELRPGYHIIWVIVAGKDEGTHIRFSGPHQVVEKYKKGFDDWLKALK